MVLPFRPEPLDKLQARYSQALFGITARSDVEAGRVSRPGENPQHIFDFEDGLRLIVSIDEDDTAGDPPFLHVSASVFDLPDGTLYRELSTKLSGGIDAMKEHFRLYAERMFRLLSGNDKPLELNFWSSGGIPQWKQEIPGSGATSC